MEITLKKISVAALCDGYVDNGEQGVVAYGGRLDVRPPYQREFVYKTEQQHAVIQTVYQGFPLNVMYWAEREDGTYEIIDGQQRTLSLCEYVANNYSVKLGEDKNTFQIESLQPELRQRILDYELMIYVCQGTDTEKLAWFKTINIAGEKLTNQELLNAVYHGSWVSAAKKKFSKTSCVAYKIGSNYVSGSPIRQDYLETALSWISGGKIQEYMSAHRHDPNADELYDHFEKIIDWIPTVYNVKRKEMKGVNWGILFGAYGTETYDPVEMEKRVKELMKDSDVQRKSGIYEYLLDNREQHLNLRAFDDNTKREVYERQDGVCPLCGKHFEISEMEADHIIPWSRGGKTFIDNCQMLCRTCNRLKSDK